MYELQILKINWVLKKGYMIKYCDKIIICSKMKKKQWLTGHHWQFYYTFNLNIEKQIWENGKKK